MGEDRWGVGFMKTDKQPKERTYECTNEQTNEGTSERIHERTRERTNKRVNKHTNERTHERTNARTNEQTSERTDGRTNERTSERTNGRTNKRVNERRNQQASERANEWRSGSGGRNLTTSLLLRKSEKLPFLAPEVQWALKVYRVCSIHVFFKCFEPCPYLVCHIFGLSGSFSKYNNTFCQNTALSTTCSIRLRKCTIFRKL